MGGHTRRFNFEMDEDEFKNSRLVRFLVKSTGAVKHTVLRFDVSLSDVRSAIKGLFAFEEETEIALSYDYKNQEATIENDVTFAFCFRDFIASDAKGTFYVTTSRKRSRSTSSPEDGGTAKQSRV